MRLLQRKRDRLSSWGSAMGILGAALTLVSSSRIVPVPKTKGIVPLTGHAFAIPISGKSTSPCNRRLLLDRAFSTAQVLALGGTGAALVGGMPVPAHAISSDPTTGILLPDVGEIASAIPTDWSAVENPFSMNGTPTTSSMFTRLDTTPDSIFYTNPRFVEHVDSNAVQLMANYISTQALKPGDAVLDLGSSWTSHIEPTVAKTLSRVVGVGMNEQELQANPSLTEHVVQDLNVQPRLDLYRNDEFDVVLCQLSIDYFTKPLEVMKEVSRILKPGGKVHVLFSNRLFLSKAVGLWTGADDLDHAYYVGCYLHFCGGNFESIVAQDLSTRKGRDKRIVGDPLYVVVGQKGRGSL